jgi:flagella basal body P-ring formation protein FlgA
MSRFLPLVFLLAQPGLHACSPVEHDPITARDLAQFVPVFGKLPPDTPIAAAPGPNVHRVFHSLELVSVARNYSLDLAGAEDLCFEWPMEVPERSRMLEAMQAALPDPGTRIELLETSRYAAPRGRIDFHREDLSAPALPSAATPVVWRGNVVYGNNQHFAIWARVRITAHVSRLIAIETIREGMPIAPAQVRVESSDAFPSIGDAASRIDQLAGRIALRTIPAGSEIHLSQVAQPPEVKRGDTVSVEVLSGSARLAFTGKSESDGRKGEIIPVRNPHSNKIFQARVDGKDRALVDIRGLGASDTSHGN